MESVFLSLGKNAVYIFPILLLIGLVVFRWLWKSWKEWKDAYFSLEREIAMRTLGQAIAMSVLVVILLCAEFSVYAFILPSLPASSLIPTPTLDLLATIPAALPTAGAGTVAVTAPPPPAGSQGCTAGKLEVTSPTPGTEVTGTVTLIGSVNIPNFGFYKYEVALRGTDTWTTIAAENKVKINEELGVLNTSVLTPGDYLLRIVVIDTAGQPSQTCIVTLRIKGQ
jgi:hypothetical protein